MDSATLVVTHVLEFAMAVPAAAMALAPVRGHLRMVDLCSMLGNLVENAVEAVSSAEGGECWVEAVAREVTPGAIGITVRNPIAAPVSLGDDGLPVADRQGHGVGLASVRSVAERHGGTLDVRVEGGTFLVGVILFHA